MRAANPDLHLPRDLPRPFGSLCSPFIEEVAKHPATDSPTPPTRYAFEPVPALNPFLSLNSLRKIHPVKTNPISIALAFDSSLSTASLRAQAHAPADAPAAPVNPNAVTISIADGSTSKTYETIIGQLKPFVSDSVNLQSKFPPPARCRISTCSSTTRCSSRMLHNDVYEFRSKSNPAILDKFKTVL